MGKKKLYIAFIAAFLLLYLIVACISFVHSISFFSIGNTGWMSCLLGFSFELGQAVVLASILLSDNRKSLLTWALFIVLTAVQCIGNVYSVYAYMSQSAVEYYRYLQEPLLFWLQGVDQQTVKVIISWITGALLPIIALGMTGMVASNIRLIRGAENMNDRPADPDISDGGHTDEVTAASTNESNVHAAVDAEAARSENFTDDTDTTVDASADMDAPSDFEHEIIQEPQPAAVVEKNEILAEEPPADDSVKINMLEPVIPDDGSSGGRTELRFMPRNLKRRK